MASLRPLDPELLFTTLAKHGVDSVLVGALAARLQGFPRMTADADITPARTPDNLARLAPTSSLARRAETFWPC